MRTRAAHVSAELTLSEPQSSRSHWARCCLCASLDCCKPSVHLIGVEKANSHHLWAAFCCICGRRFLKRSSTFLSVLFLYLKLVPLEHLLKMNYQSLGSSLNAEMWLLAIIFVLCIWVTLKTLPTHTLVLACVCTYMLTCKPVLTYPNTPVSSHCLS